MFGVELYDQESQICVFYSDINAIKLTYEKIKSLLLLHTECFE